MQQGLLSAFNPSDAYSQNLRQPVQGDMTLGNLVSYFMPISRNVMPYEDSPRLGAGDYNLDFPQVMKDAYSGINKFGQAFRGELSPEQLQQLAFDTSMNVTGGSLLGSRVIPNAVPSGGILGMGVSKTPNQTGLLGNSSKLNDFDTDLTLYHGSPKPLTEIKKDRGFYLSSDPDYANNYTNPNFSASAKSKGDFEENAPNITPVFVKKNVMFDTRLPEHRKIFQEKFLENYGNRTGLTEKGLPDWTDGEDFAEFFKKEKLPFKGVILDEGGFINELGEVVERPISYAVFDSKVLKSVYDKNTPKTGLLGKSNEIKDPLIVQHNINETALMESDRLGGLPVPSLAVSKVDNPLLGFGDVTLVGNPNMAKPSGSNPVYRADAYTTRRPKPDIFVNKEAEDFAETLTTPFKNMPKGSSVSQLDGYSVNQSIAEDLYRGFEGSSSNIPLRAKYMIDKGLLDPKQFETQYDITKFVRENFSETEDYTNYITKLKKDMIASGGGAKEKLFVTYTNNGRKYIPATLENYVKLMKKKRGAGEETTFPSMGALRAKLTPKFKNITEVKSERNRVVNREKFEEVKNQVNLDYEDLLSDLSKKLPEKTDWRTSEELFEDLILNRLGSHPYSKPYEQYIDDSIKKSASELREKLKSIPTEYFEIKPQRGVKIEEFEGAIIPDNSLKSTEEILKRRGINKIFKYGSDEQRKELMKKFPELMFSVGGLGLLGIGSVEEEPVSLL